MIKFTRFAPAVLLLSFSALAPVGTMANERTIRVEIDRARIVKLPQGAQTLVMGNPAVADVTMLKVNQLMVITGKSFGSTNLIVLDKVGEQVGESFITVTPSSGKVVVHRGMHRESLSCAPECGRAIDLSDDIQYMRSVIDSSRAYDGAASASK
jgi:Flp pilus assembly secretin CpaC